LPAFAHIPEIPRAGSRGQTRRFRQPHWMS